MRFHCGISFSWKSIKKILFPILIGLLAYFGFNGIFDHFNLGFLNVYASENYNTSYTYDYSEGVNVVDLPVDNNNIKFSEFVEHIKSLSDVTNQYTILCSYDNNSITYLKIIVYDSNSTYNINFFGAGYNFTFRPTSTNSIWYYQFNISTKPNDIYSDSWYTGLVKCLQGISCKNNSSFNNGFQIGSSTTAITNGNDNNYSINFVSGKDFLYYSTRDLIITNNFWPNDTNIFYKNVIIDNISYGVGDKFPTFSDVYYAPIPDDPNDPNEPVDPVTNHKPLFNKIYWFDDNSTELGVLSSIYILLFLYCISMIILKIITIIKNTRW